MRRYQLISLLLSGAVAAMTILAGPASVGAQNTAPAATSRTEKFDVALTFNPMYAGLINGGGSFWMEGGAAQAQIHLNSNWGEVVELSGLHNGNIKSSGVGLDLINVLVGPRYTWRPRRGSKYELFGQGMVGGSHGMNGIFPALPTYTTSATGFAAEGGGGVNVKLTPTIWLRAAEIDYLRTDLPNATTGAENDLKLGFGVIVKFK